MSSEAYCKAIQRVLGVAYIQPTMTPEKVINMVNLAKVASSISFYDDKIVIAVKKKSALYITLKCYGYIIAKVLIDGGLALNVLPKSTLKQLPIDATTIKESEMIIRAFDGMRKEVCGTIILPLEIGPSLFSVKVQVMDIDLAYTMLLGIPWIHHAKAMPSTLHQRVKYINDGRLIIVKGEKELIISKPSSVPYINVIEKVCELPFQSFKVGAIKSHDKVVHDMAKEVMERSGYQIGKGLGSHLQGIMSPIMLSKNNKRYGLGY